VLDASAAGMRFCGAFSHRCITGSAIVVLFESVGLRYGDGPEILKEVSFALAPGSIHFLVGPSGSGKSSILKLIYRALKPSAGRVSLFGRDLATVARQELPELRRRIGIVFQDFRLIDHLSAFDNVALPLRVRNVAEREVRQHVGELLQWVGLADQIDAPPPTLSGGQQQRAAIARAVIGRPNLLVADEPTGNVDDAMAVRLMYLFEELNRLGTTVLIATHNEALVARFGHRQLHIENGRVAARPVRGRPVT
jgi:cell division transport system ATP-binding protein